MAALGRKVALAALPVVVAGGVLVALRPWAGDDATADPPRSTADRSVATSSAPTSSPTPEPTPDPAPEPVTVLAAGDIGRCDETVDEATAALVAQHPDAPVLALGDIAYHDGSTQNFAQCFDPSWGQFSARIHPVPGNHEYHQEGAGPYFDYFGAGAGERGKGWYSFDVGAWHVVALNSNCGKVGCEAGSEQERWLRADLAANDARCTLAFWHHPRFSSGLEHGGTDSVEELWQALLDDGVELLLSGHEHLYERTAPLDADGQVDDDGGVRQFVAGTGGGNYYGLGARIPGSEAAFVDTPGVLSLTLRPDGYDWEFLPVVPGANSDAGSDDCR